jgi:hypothetical protein
VFKFKIELRCLQLLTLAMVLLSCNENVRRSSGYYSVDSLISTQIKSLTSAKASINKSAFLDGKEEKTSLTPSDTVVWEKELQAFRFLSVINKPTNQGAYSVEDGLPDNRSNLKVKTFVSKKELPVEYLRIYYQGNLKNIRKLEAKYEESNLMYQGGRYLVMEFQDINNIPTLTYYGITGGQKMFLGDTVQYNINALVSLP